MVCYEDRKLTDICLQGKKTSDPSKPFTRGCNSSPHTTDADNTETSHPSEDTGKVRTQTPKMTVVGDEVGEGVIWRLIGQLESF